MPIETTIETAACQLVQPEGSVSALPLVGVAEDAGFEPARACTQPAFQLPTRLYMAVSRRLSERESVACAYLRTPANDLN
jgi:hypothetical protein